MAEAILRSIDPSLFIRSAGTAPAFGVHPRAIEVMREIGIDIGAGRPKSVDEFVGDHWDYVITVCDHAKEVCPIFTGAVRHRRHLGFEDPASVRGTEEEIVSAFRRVRDAIHEQFTSFYRMELGPSTRP